MRDIAANAINHRMLTIAHRLSLRHTRYTMLWHSDKLNHRTLAVWQHSRPRQRLYDRDTSINQHAAALFATKRAVAYDGLEIQPSDESTGGFVTCETSLFSDSEPLA